LVLPFHSTIRAEAITLHPVVEYSIYRRRGNIPVQVFETIFNGMPVYFINGPLFSSAGSVYSADQAKDQEKFTYFSLAALELVRHLDWQPDIIHANDWHTSLALYALRSRHSDALPAKIRTLLTVHNLPFMGGDASDVLAAYGLIPLGDEILPYWAQTQPLPLGLWAADAIVPVSPTYAKEILTPDFGCGLDPFLRTRTANISGIMNGIDVKSWDPRTDKALSTRFTAGELQTRAANKFALQIEFELKEDTRVPLMIMIGRIDYQKGLDIAFAALRKMVDQNWQFILLGSGNPELENAARTLQLDFPDRIRTIIRFDSALSRRMYGGADVLLMPSRYEPCGLAQMIAMRYGCVPVVHATGGLRDSVHEEVTGFLFQDESTESMLEALSRALSMFAIPENWQRFQRNGMAEDFSWTGSAQQYAFIYRSLLSS
jgi:starch synthase